MSTALAVMLLAIAVFVGATAYFRNLLEVVAKARINLFTVWPASPPVPRNPKPQTPNPSPKPQTSSLSRNA